MVKIKAFDNSHLTGHTDSIISSSLILKIIFYVTGKSSSVYGLLPWYGGKSECCECFTILKIPLIYNSFHYVNTPNPQVVVLRRVELRRVELRRHL